MKTRTFTLAIAAGFFALNSAYSADMAVKSSPAWVPDSLSGYIDLYGGGDWWNWNYGGGYNGNDWLFGGNARINDWITPA